MGTVKLKWQVGNKRDNKRVDINVHRGNLINNTNDTESNLIAMVQRR